MQLQQRRVPEALAQQIFGLLQAGGENNEAMARVLLDDYGMQLPPRPSVEDDEAPSPEEQEGALAEGGPAHGGGEPSSPAVGSSPAGVGPASHRSPGLGPSTPDSRRG